MISAYNLAIGVKQKILPYEPCIKSALDIVDEFCVGYDPRFDDPNDFLSIDPRVKPIEIEIDFAEWDFINIALTKARKQCVGDWCLYLEMDEVLHEKDSKKYIESIEIADKIKAEAVYVQYLDIQRDLGKIHSHRQKFTKNIPEIYHKTSDYMIGICNSPIWQGKYILRGYDDVSYYDSRTSAWFNEHNIVTANGDFDDNLYRDKNIVPFIWHYGWYNIERKHKQGINNMMWQYRTYGILELGYDVDSVINSFKEQIIIEHSEKREIDTLLKDGYFELTCSQPKYITEWASIMRE